VSATQQPQKPTHVLSLIIHHPIQWIRGLDEWKHFTSLRDGKSRREGKKRKWRAFNPDPLLFPATWMPLRWLQIYAISKAFATDPDQYRWCSPEKQSLIVHRLMNIYLIQLALGDEWSRVFLGEYRVGLGIVAVSCYFIGELDHKLSYASILFWAHNFYTSYRQLYHGWFLQHSQ
jgi:tryptophan-rich sensory protein